MRMLRGKIVLDAALLAAGAVAPTQAGAGIAYSG